jgi:AraC family transcriptional regulator, regulatory protein of adaptative response / methylated-DNA-[protein]-cysteine methyltransferase
MGFRACKLCLPDGPSREHENLRIVVETCRLIERSDRDLSLLELAEDAKLSPGHLHRIFKKATGLTPKEYFGAHRLKRGRDVPLSGQSAGRQNGISVNGSACENVRPRRR